MCLLHLIAIKEYVQNHCQRLCPLQDSHQEKLLWDKYFVFNEFAHKDNTPINIMKVIEKNCYMCKEMHPSFPLLHAICIPSFLLTWRNKDCPLNLH